MSLLSDIGNWFGSAWDRIFDVGSKLISAGISLLPLPPSSEPSPTNNGGGNGTPTNPGGGGSIPGNGGTSGGYFTDTISFLTNLTKRETWLRVGLVLLGILLCFIALRMMVVGKSPIQQVMDDIGV